MINVDTQKNAFMFHCHVQPVDLTNEDCVLFRLDIHPDLLNPMGVVHGGALYSLADNAAGYAAHADGRHHVTQTSSFHFLRNQRTGSIFATGKVVHRGHTTSLIAVEITGDDGTLLATGEFTFFCITPDKSTPKQEG